MAGLCGLQKRKKEGKKTRGVVTGPRRVPFKTQHPLQIQPGAAASASGATRKLRSRCINEDGSTHPLTELKLQSEARPLENNGGGKGWKVFLKSL